METSLSSAEAVRPENKYVKMFKGALVKVANMVTDYVQSLNPSIPEVVPFKAAVQAETAQSRFRSPIQISTEAQPTIFELPSRETPHLRSIARTIYGKNRQNNQFFEYDVDGKNPPEATMTEKVKVGFHISTLNFVLDNAARNASPNDTVLKAIIKEVRTRTDIRKFNNNYLSQIEGGYVEKQYIKGKLSLESLMVKGEMAPRHARIATAALIATAIDAGHLKGTVRIDRDLVPGRNIVVYTDDAGKEKFIEPSTNTDREVSFENLVATYGSRATILGKTKPKYFDDSQLLSA